MKNYFIIFLIVLTVLISEELIPGDGDDINIVLVYPGLTKKILYNTDSKFLPTDDWELFFMSSRIKYRMIEDKNLDEIKKDDDLVVIPSLEAVTGEMIEDIEEILRKGKGILITGNFAAYDEQGNRNNNFQKRILDFQISSLSEINSVSVNHTLKGNSPFSYNLKPGCKILLKREPELYHGEILSNECSPAGCYFPLDKTFPDNLSGIISENKSAGRLLWLGYDFGQMIGNEKDKFLLNVFGWLASKPQAFINYLPGNYSSAGIICKYIDMSADLNFTRTSSHTHNMNFLINPAMFEKLKDENNEVTDSSNIIVIWDDFFFSNKSLTQKRDWLQKTKSIIGDITKQNYFGISTYGGMNDSTSLKSIKEADYTFVYSPGYSDAFAIDYDSSENIYYFIHSSVPALNYNSELKFIINNNGLFYLNADSLVSGGVLNRYLNDPDIWITTFSELLSWNLMKMQMDVSVQLIDDEYEVRVGNKSSSDIENVGIWLTVPDIKGNLLLKNPDNSVKFTFDNDKKMYFLKINRIKSHQNLVYDIYGMNE